MMKRTQGVTLMELVVTVAVLAILAVTAVVLYSDQVRSSRRADGINAIFAISLAEERYRTSNTQYGTLAQAYNNVTTSTGGYYTLAVSGVSSTGYTITATAVGDQARDVSGSTSCSVLQLTVSNGAVTKTPSSCWS